MTYDFIKQRVKKKVTELDNLELYRKSTKKYINKILRMKNSDKKIGELLEVFKIYSNTF